VAILKPRNLVAVLLILLSLPLLAIPRIAYSAASLALPGTGELLQGENTRGGILLGIDLLSIYAFVETDQQIDRQRDAYMRHANLFAGVPIGMPNRHYQAIQDYPSSSYYNDIQEMMARNYYLIYNYDPESYADYMARNTYLGDETWNWQNDAAWNEYKNQRKRHQRTKMSHNLALGMMLFNRALSALDSAILSGKNAGTVYLAPTPDQGAMLHYQLNF